MAKSRRNRANASSLRKDPISKPVKPPSDPELAALREAKVLPIVRDLTDASPKSRSAAAAAISSIIQDVRCRKLLLREQIVHIVLTQTITDAALESRAAGWGILQVLAQEEEADFCVHLYRQDVLTAMNYAARSVSEKLVSRQTDFAKLPKAESASWLSIASSLVSLASSLAQTDDDDIVSAISSQLSIAQLLFDLISSTKLSEVRDNSEKALLDDTESCLLVLSEDNPALATLLQNSRNSNSIKYLNKSKEEDSPRGVFACGILHNLAASLVDAKHQMKVGFPPDSVLVPRLVKTTRSIVAQPIRSEGSDWSRIEEAQQLALEILASVGTSIHLGHDEQPLQNGATKPMVMVKSAEADEDMDDAGNAGSDEEDESGADGDPDEAGSDDDSDDEMDEEEMEADMDLVTGADDGDEDDHAADELPTLRCLVHDAVPDLIRIATLTSSDEHVLRVQPDALAALNNIAWSISLIDFSGSPTTNRSFRIQKLWMPAGLAIWREVISPILASDTADIELASQVTGLAWAVARGLPGDTIPRTEAGEHRRFISLYRATRGDDGAQIAAQARGDDDPFQALGVKCVGVLGRLAADPAPLAINREIGIFLITLLQGLPDIPAADAVEALNQLFDIYADETWQCDREVFWKDGFQAHLEAILPKTKAMLKTVDKREQPELRTRADEAVMNLDRFLAYKRKHKPPQ